MPEAEKHLVSYFDSLEIPMIFVVDDLNISFFNLAAQVRFGLNEGAHKNQISDCIKSFSDNSRALILENVNEYFAGNCRTKNVVTINAELSLSASEKISFSPIFDDNRTIAGVFLSFDTTCPKKLDMIRVVIDEILEASDSITNLEQEFKVMHSSISKLMKADNFYIALLDKNNGYISFPYFVDEYEESAEPIKIEKSLTGYVIKTEKAHLIDINKYNKLLASGEIEIIGEPPQIWLGIPLKVQNEVIGAIVLQDYKNMDVYTVKEQEIIQTISYPISRVIERKMKEEEKQKLIEELRASNLSKDKFFSIISHDLRGPFNAILGYAAILRNELKELSSQELTQFIDSLYKSTYNVYKLLNNLLEYSRFKLDRIEFNPQKINLCEIVIENIVTLKGSFEKKHIAIENNVQEDVHVLADEHMLQSVLQNLLTNALKFSFKKGKIVISANEVLLNGTKMIEISVKDFGIGMAEEDIAALFKLDSIVSREGTSEEMGTGFGLLIVQEFVEKHGGKIKVISAQNQGSTFLFTIPSA